MPATHTSQLGVRENLPGTSPCVPAAGAATTNFFHLGNFGPVVTFTGVTSISSGAAPPGIAPFICMSAGALYMRGVPLARGVYTYTVSAGLSNGGTATFDCVQTIGAAPWSVTSIDQDEGPWQGGETINVHGIGLGAVETIQFGLQEATNIVHVSSTLITCTVPSSGVGRAIVVVSVNGGITTNLTYTYTATVSFEFDIRRDPGISIQAQRNDAPSTATFRVETDEPLIGQRTTIYDPRTRLDLHTGSVLRTQQVYDEGDLTWMVTTKDDSWLLDRRRPFGTWTDIPANEIAEEIRVNYTTGFTGNRIEADLPPISITFDGTQSFSSCMTAICQAVRADHFLADEITVVPGTSLIWNAEGKDILLGYDLGTVEVIDEFVGNGTVRAQDQFIGDGVTVTFNLTEPLVNSFWPHTNPDHLAIITEQHVNPDVIDHYYNANTYREGRIGLKSPAGIPTAPVLTTTPWLGAPIPSDPTNLYNLRHVYMRVAFLHSDGTESFVSPRSAIIDVLKTQGWTSTIPVGGVSVIGRRLYMAAAIGNRQFIENYVLDVLDNTTTTVTATGAVPLVDYSNVGIVFIGSSTNGGSAAPLGFPYPNGIDGEASVLWQYDPITNSITKGAAIIDFDVVTQTYIEPAIPTPGDGFWQIGIQYNTPNPGATSTFELKHQLVLSPVTGLIGLGYVSYSNGFGPLNEPITAPGGSGIWTYDSITNSITRTTGAPETPSQITTSTGQHTPPNIVFDYWTGSSVKVVDIINASLLMDPPPLKTVEGSQLRNRILVLGKGTTTKALAPSGGGGFVLGDSTMFKAGVQIRVGGGDLYTVSAVSYNSAAPTVTTTTPLIRNYASGTSVRLYVVVNDTDAQAFLATQDDEEGDGVHEATLNFTDWLISATVTDAVPGTRANAEVNALTNRGLAVLADWAWPVESITYATRDQNTKSGAFVTFNLIHPPIVGVFKIQTVRIDQVDEGYEDGLPLTPRFNVTASAVRFEFSDLLRKVMLSDSGGTTDSSSSFGGSGGGGGVGGTPAAPDYWGEIPSGTINGSNTVFTLSHAYAPGYIAVYKNGIRTYDFTETSASTFTMNVAPKTGDNLIVDSKGHF